MLDAYHCANCGRAIDVAAQKFCPDCGQPTPAHRIDWHFLGHELEHSVLHMDRGVLYTLRNLMLRPGHLMRDYLEGRRAGIVKPLLLVMMMAAVVVLLTKYVAGAVPIEIPDFGQQPQAGRAAEVSMAYQKTTMAWINSHFALFTLVLLPLEAAMFKLAFRRFREINYPEWLVIMAFLMSQGFVIWAIGALWQRWVPGMMIVISVVAVVYSIISLMQFFPAIPRWKIVLRGLLGYGLYLLGQTLVSALVALVFGMVMGYRLNHGG